MKLSSYGSHYDAAAADDDAMPRIHLQQMALCECVLIEISDH